MQCLSSWVCWETRWLVGMGWFQVGWWQVVTLNFLSDHKIMDKNGGLVKNGKHLQGIMLNLQGMFIDKV